MNSRPFCTALHLLMGGQAPAAIPDPHPPDVRKQLESNLQSLNAEVERLLVALAEDRPAPLAAAK